MVKGDRGICARKYVYVPKSIVPLAQAVEADPDPFFAAVRIFLVYFII